MPFCHIFPIPKKRLQIFRLGDRFPRVRPLHPLKICWFFTSEFSPECFENFMKINKAGVNRHTPADKTLSYNQLYKYSLFFSRFSTELCSNDYAKCEHGLRIVKPQDVMKRLGTRTVRHFCCAFFCTKAHWPLGWTPKRSMTTLSFDQLGADCGNSVPLYFLW